MKLAVFDDNRLGVVEDDAIFDVTDAVTPTRSWPPVFVNALIDTWHESRSQVERARREAAAKPLASVELQPPVPCPLNIVGAPANYRKHIAEMGALGSGGRSMRELGFFLKASSSLLRPGGVVVLPKGSARRFDHECELAVVIGQRCKDVPVADALSVVFGYSCLMDLTLRISATQSEERAMRKSFDTFTPMGPWIVTADEVPNPQDLDLELRVNGELRQQSSTSQMIVSISEQISYISSVMTLQPGDVIATGTPDGVGEIRPGDTVSISIDRVGAFDVQVREAIACAPKSF
jgi:2-keto-4-pentenoate hydratase/2-oxohepta-3-ene-1,7-dioic acid hydratase in catechol pathway